MGNQLSHLGAVCAVAGSAFGAAPGDRVLQERLPPRQRPVARGCLPPFREGLDDPQAASVTGPCAGQSRQPYSHLRQTGAKLAAWDWREALSIWQA